MNKKYIITSILSAAMVASSAAAAVYTSAASIAPVSVPVSIAAVTSAANLLIPTYPGFVDPDSVIQRPTTPFSETAASAATSSREQFEELNYSWIHGSPESSRYLWANVVLADYDELVAVADAAGRAYQETEDFLGLSYEVQDYVYAESQEEYTELIQKGKYGIAFAEKLRKLQIQAAKDFCTANGLTYYGISPYPNTDRAEITISFSGDAAAALALFSMDDVSEIYVDDQPYTNPMNEVMPAIEAPYVEPVINDILSEDPSGCRVAIYTPCSYLRGVESEFNALTEIADSRLFFTEVNDYPCAGSLYEMLCDKRDGHVLDDVLTRHSLTADRLIEKSIYYAVVVVSSEELEALSQDTDIEYIMYVDEFVPEHPTASIDDNIYPYAEGPTWFDHDCTEPPTAGATCNCTLPYVESPWFDHDCTEPYEEPTWFDHDCTHPHIEGPTVETTTTPISEWTYGAQRNTADSYFVRGDANCDLKVNISDAVSVLQFVANAEKYPLSKKGLLCADADGIPGITGSDAIAIQQIDANIITAY